MHGSISIFWANLTPFSLQLLLAGGGDLAATLGHAVGLLLLASVGSGGGARRARSHCRFVLPLIHLIPNSLTYLVPLILKRQM